ncbi:antibiotic biosynthesis monooxygenase family protein [Acuticoccus sediminis]|uniref:antibiotic biosynthesis monooxygenase family protein n=1 Tax=Acuticoccus sediminis TaxID=2184697 RepID=UPI001CFC95DF|nr:antibiotic biosynthesis monooxygenase family protein [Acuticoccus sediminis]
MHTLLDNAPAHAANTDQGAAMPRPVTLINVFEVPEGQREATLAGWERAAAFLSVQPGYLGTALHESLAPDARFRFINVAQWTTPDAFRAAAAAMREQRIFPEIPGLAIHPALYTVIRNAAPEAA